MCWKVKSRRAHIPNDHRYYLELQEHPIPKTNLDSRLRTETPYYPDPIKKPPGKQK